MSRTNRKALSCLVNVGKKENEREMEKSRSIENGLDIFIECYKGRDISNTKLESHTNRMCEKQCQTESDKETIRSSDLETNPHDKRALQDKPA